MYGFFGLQNLFTTEYVVDRVTLTLTVQNNHNKFGSSMFRLNFIPVGIEMNLQPVNFPPEDFGSGCCNFVYKMLPLY